MNLRKIFKLGFYTHIIATSGLLFNCFSFAKTSANGVDGINEVIQSVGKPSQVCNRNCPQEELSESICTKSEIPTEIEGASFSTLNNAIFFKSKLSINADGAPTAYHADDTKALDYLANAGAPGNWWGIATIDGTPCLQNKTDPAPGYYVSTTALEDSSIMNKCNPQKYVNSQTIPYVVVPPQLLGKDHGLSLGDYALVINEKTSPMTYAFAVIADIGPKNKIGEGSIALAEQILGKDKSSAKKGAATDGVIYYLFPKSKESKDGSKFPKGDNDQERKSNIQTEGSRYFKQWFEQLGDECRSKEAREVYQKIARP